MIIKAKNVIINTKDFASITSDSEKNYLTITLSYITFLIQLKDFSNSDCILDLIFEAIQKKEELLILNSDIIEKVQTAVFDYIGEGDDCE